MSTAKKLPVVDPSRQYVEDALKDGRAAKQVMSLKAIRPDTKFQARVVQLDMDHVKKLGDALQHTSDLYPITVFEVEDGRGVRHILADGFHRHEAYRRAHRDAIPAVVIKGTEHDALSFAAMCNRELCLPRNQEDLQKALLMLLSDKVWFNRADAWIADHVGVVTSTVSKYRAKFCEESGIDPPKLVTGRDGRTWASKKNGRTADNIRIREQPHRNSTVRNATYRQQTIHVPAGLTEDEAKEHVRQRANEIAEMESREKHLCLHPTVRMARYGVACTIVRHGAIHAYTIKNVLARFVAEDNLKDCLAAVASVALITPSYPCCEAVIVTPNKATASGQVAEMSGRIGITFMTPGDLLAHLGVQHDFTHLDSPAN